MIRKALLAIPVLLLTLAACKGGEESPPPDVTAQAPPAAQGAAPAPMSSRSEPVGGEQAQGGSIQFDFPANWPQQAPATSMRMAQATIPGAGGPGDLVVFFFGPGGG